MNDRAVEASLSVVELGWRPCFQQQLGLDELEFLRPARVIEQHRDAVVVADGEAVFRIELNSSMVDLVVGDWILIDPEQRFQRCLERSSCFQRKAAGTGRATQRIAANVDTAFILSSMNEDFSLNRIERYLALVHEAGAEPVVVLTKLDQAESPDAAAELSARLHRIDPLLAVEAINGLDASSAAQLSPWLRAGETIVLLGSSGVGKSTLTNTLMQAEVQSTGGIREDDAKGRHTTTRRSLMALPSGALILDTPGMREIQLADCRDGLASTFADIEALAEGCRFKDCQHLAEPACRVRAALAAGELDERRLANYQKLLREEALNAASLAERRAENRAQGRFYKQAKAESKRFKGR
ncbi:ribosome small subunit-dependent GTPase A [Wenzhouxiangella marina]|uniref:Small ribosomal subunit biogenesis GTPase RsgA n=1 Tax=Wenzhouxiangella marina TaxID=1579979 RepID=A0A0K0XU26_9GAMM|nr:ribosome small subunit-dependent GTPase A [Wenzhouxiangella marina]AKS41132.1 Putative ribosome biogenesis GTPase RsgA [Wenzhouxiangella marina]MBB6088011.1 ribosome biogenesis GTPase [Wenzhouxiangella marina]